MLSSGGSETTGETRAAAPAVHVIASQVLTRRRILTALRAAGVRVATVAAEMRPASDCRGIFVAAMPLGDDTVETAVARLRQDAPLARIVVVDRSPRCHVARTVIKQGADAFLLDRDVPVALGPAVHAVAAGQIVFPRDERSRIESPALSARERETLELLVDGLTNAEIAERMVLAESTVKSHLTTAFAKLGVRSRAQAVAAILDRDTGLAVAIAPTVRTRLEYR